MFDFKKLFLDLIFPVHCLGCKQEGKWLCRSCLGKINLNFSSTRCQVDQSNFLSGVWVAADYRQNLVAEILKNFKYNFVLDLGEEISSLLIKFLFFKINQGEISDFDLVIPIPLARKRLLFRGFNQSEVLAERITQNFGWPLGQNIVSRQNSSQPQVGLRKKDRLVNVRGIFKIKYPASEFLRGKKILLVDDVVTTGATLDECAKVLKEAGAKEIWALVLAKG